MPEDVNDIEKRRQQRREDATKAKAAQYAKDIAAIDAIETEMGDELATLPVNNYRPSTGLPTLVGVRAPTADQYKRFGQMIRKAEKNAEERQKALDLLAESCWAYPSELDARKAMKEAYPAVLLGIGVKATELAELNLEEGKG